MFIGLDCGQARDYASLIVIRAAGRRPGGGERPVWRVEQAWKVPRGTSYPDLGRAWIAAVVRMVDRYGAGYAAIDATGVGRAVCDDLRERGVDALLDATGIDPVRLIAVTATGGKAVGGAWPDVTVPARLLTESVIVAGEQGGLDARPGAPWRAALLEEIRGDLSSVAARDASGGHFDSASALKLAVWLADRIADQLLGRELRHVE